MTTHDHHRNDTMRPVVAEASGREHRRRFLQQAGGALAACTCCDLFRSAAAAHPDSKPAAKANSSTTFCGNIPPGQFLGGVPDKASWSLNQLWDVGATLRIRLKDGENSAWKKRVREKTLQISRQWCDYANLQFQIVEEGDCDLSINFDPYQFEGRQFGFQGLWNCRIGNDCQNYALSPHSMNLIFPVPNADADPAFVEEEFHRLILHEFGHALGMLHEHQRLDRPIAWDVPKLMRYAEEKWDWDSRGQMVKTQILDVATQPTAGTVFDAKSIMMYEYPLGLAYEPIDGRPGIPNLSRPYVFQRNTKLSPFDKISAAIAYPKPAPASGVRTLVPGEQPLPGKISQMGQVARYTVRTAEKGTYKISLGGNMPGLIALLAKPYPIGSRGLPNNILAAEESTTPGEASLTYDMKENTEYHVEVRHSSPIKGTGEFTIAICSVR